MGVTQAGGPETSGNTMSKKQEKTRRTSGDSSTTPKADQPSCLREAFICLLLKRTERNNRDEDPPTSNQNKEDKESVRGKKQRVTGGSIFCLPCLRSSEDTSSYVHSNNSQDKIEEQSNQVMAEEELKPYSKASFLRKIRGYRLMRERDTTEKEKVIEIAQCTHSMESVLVKEHQQQKSEKVLETNKHEDMVQEKGKILAEQESRTIVFGGNAHNLLEQDGHAECTEEMEDSIREQESPAEELSEQGKDLPEQEGHRESAVNIGKDSVEQEKHVENVEKVEKLGNILQKQDSHANGAGGMEKGFVEEDNCAENLENLGSELVEKVADLATELEEKVEDLCNEFVEKMEVVDSELVKKVEYLGRELVGKVEDLGPELVGKVENLGNELKEKVQILGSENVEDIGSELIKHDSQTEGVCKQEKCLTNQISKAKKSGHRAKDLIEQKSQRVEAEKIGNYIPEQDSQADEEREKEDNFPEQDSNAVKVEKVENDLLEQQRQAAKVGKAFLGQDNPADQVEKVENILSELDIHVKMVGVDLELENHGEIAQELENTLFEMDSHAEKAGKCGIVCLQTESHSKKVGEQGMNLLEHDTFYLENEEPQKEFPEQNHEEIVRVKEKDMLTKGSQAQKEGESGQNTREFPQTSSLAEDVFRDILIQEGAHLFQGSVTLKACPQDSFTSRALGENGELDTSVRKKSLATNTDSTTILEEPHTQQESSRKSVYEDEDDTMGCEATDWGSLKVEVSDMIQWLVEEASDRLTSYTQESHGTG